MKKIVLCCLVFTAMHGKDEGQGNYLHAGNLLLKSSQQPNSQLGMGQNIIDKGDLLGYFAPFGLKGKCQDFVILTPIILYGITDNLSILASLPIAAEEKVNNNRSEGLQDLLIQGEYAFYNNDQYTYADQATVIASIFLPTGSAKKQPNTGFGSPAFLLGGTFSHTGILWYYYFAVEGIMTTRTKNKTQFGNEFLYQWGVGRNLGNPGGKSILTIMIEFSGIYTGHDTIAGVRNPNSGGNIIFAGPSLWFSTERFIIHPDIAFPIAQRLFGKQNKWYYSVGVTLGWKFNG